MPTIAKALSKNLKRLRKIRGLTQEKLSLELGFHRNTVQRWESTGGVTPENFAQLAAYFGVEETDLVYPGEPPAPIKVEHSIADCLAEVTRAALKGAKKS